MGKNIYFFAGMLLIALLFGCGDSFQVNDFSSNGPFGDPGDPGDPKDPDNPPPPDPPAADLGLYDTFEVQTTNNKSYANPFNYNQITFTLKLTAPSGKTWTVDGFYDGDGRGGQSGPIWKARFMPNEQGKWNYTTSWSDNTSGDSGQFVVGPQANPLVHGHVQRQGKYLVNDDSTTHYWYGGKWLGPEAYGPTSKNGQSNPRRLSDGEILGYLDFMKQTGHNGLLMKTGLAPIEDDKMTWDLTWIKRGEWFVRQMGARGIYVQINFFDTWSRKRGGFFENGQLYYDTNGALQVFDVWRDGDDPAKRNYLRTLIARYGGYYNVYWELGNEMEHAPNNMSSFANLANSKYIPWIRQADPYDLPIGISETPTAGRTNVDVVFRHQTNAFPGPAATDRPEIMNELVGGGDAGMMWEDRVIRNSASRFSFRRTFWRMFTYGGSGSSEATWLNIKTPLNSAVRSVMEDHGKLRELVDGLGVQPHQMKIHSGWVSNGPGGVDYGRTRYVEGQVYVTYFSGRGSHGAGQLQVRNLPAGNYDATFLNPINLQVTMKHQLTGGPNLRFAHPAFNNDMVLRIKKIQ